MAGNRVEVLLTAKDQISGNLGSLKSNVGSAVTSAVASIAVLTAAIAGTAIAFGSLGSGLTKAMDLQTQGISQTYGLATVMGSTVSDAALVTKNLTKELITMGDALPGVTEDYQKFAGALSTTVAFGAKGDMKKYAADIKELSKTGGLLAATSGADAVQGASALNKFVAGGMSENEAFASADLFQKNQDFKAYLAQAQKQLGFAGKDFQKQLTNEQRIAVVNLAGSMKFTPEMIAAFGNTADTQFQAIKSKLFNPVTGIFGFSREIAGLDGRTGLEAVTTLMGQVVKLSDAAGKWLSDKGINLDPILALGKMADTLSAWASAATSLLGGDGSALGSMLQGLKASLLSAPAWIANSINGGLNQLGKLMKAISPKQAGGFLADLLNNVGSALASIKVEDISAAVKWAMDTVAEMIKGINWAALGEGLVDTIAKIIGSFNLESAANLLYQAIKGLIDGIIGIVKSTIKQVLAPAAKVLDSASGDGKVDGQRVQKKEKSLTDGTIFLEPIAPVKKSTGSNLLDLLSSESSLPSLSAFGSNSSQSSTFAPVINLTASAGQDARATADYILSELNNQFLSYKDAALV